MRHCFSIKTIKAGKCYMLKKEGTPLVITGLSLLHESMETDRQSLANNTNVVPSL